MINTVASLEALNELNLVAGDVASYSTSILGKPFSFICDGGKWIILPQGNSTTKYILVFENISTFEEFSVTYTGITEQEALILAEDRIRGCKKTRGYYKAFEIEENN